MNLRTLCGTLVVVGALAVLPHGQVHAASFSTQGSPYLQMNALYGGGSSGYTTTYTATPSQTHYYQGSQSGSYYYSNGVWYYTPARPATPAPKPTPTPTPTPTPNLPAPPVTQPGTNGVILTVDEQTMVNMVNAERAKANLQPLTVNAALTQVARLKSQDMIANNYFAHQSPTYGSPFDMMRNAGITYRFAGENLAGAPNVQTAQTNLMNSPGHRDNILNPNYTQIGIGAVKGGPYGEMFSQEFSG